MTTAPRNCALHDGRPSRSHGARVVGVDTVTGDEHDHVVVDGRLREQVASPPGRRIIWPTARRRAKRSPTARGVPRGETTSDCVQSTALAVARSRPALARRAASFAWSTGTQVASLGIRSPPWCRYRRPTPGSPRIPRRTSACPSARARPRPLGADLHGAVDDRRAIEIANARDRGQQAARLCGLNLIAHLRAALDDDLGRVSRCIRLTGYVNSTPDFTGQSQVMNGASDLFVQVFGDSGGHTRIAIGVTALPYGVGVEVEGIFEIR